MYKQKQDEAEDNLSILIEENKSITIQLSQSERDNSKLKDLIIEFEKQVTMFNSVVGLHYRLLYILVLLLILVVDQLLPLLSCSRSLHIVSKFV